MPGLLAAVVVSIVLGILGMHALSTHGVTSEADHGGHPAMSGTSSDTVAPAGSPALDPVIDPAPAGDGVGSGAGGGHDMGGMVMLCAAMLAATAAALLLLTLGTRRTPRFWALLPATTGVATGWVTSRLGTGPPPVWEFSVVRC